MSEPARLLLIGATGLIGQAVIAAAAGHADLRLIAVARREVPLPPGARMEVLVAPPERWAEAIAAARAEVCAIALGTTIRQAGGDRAAFRAVDHDLVLASAAAAKAAGVRRLIAVSSVGAAAASRNFYLSVKGETETALAKLRFHRLDLLRPGLLRGRRAGPLRPGERAAMLASPLTDALLHGSWRRYRSIGADQVAQAILALAREKAGGRFVHEHDALLRAIQRARLPRGGG